MGISIEIWIWADKHACAIGLDWISEKQLKLCMQPQQIFRYLQMDACVAQELNKNRLKNRLFMVIVILK